MTLCAAWIRQAKDTEELVFATDSCLTGGEKWKHGIKLFELPRKDCLLCFAGNTIRAYPLVLNLVSSIHLDEYLQSPSATLEEVLDFLSEQFTNLVNTITELNKEDLHRERGAAQFLYGGWDWQKGLNGGFRVWKLYYSSSAEGFIFDELTADETKTRFYAFLGNANNINIEDEAKDRLKKLIYEEDRQDDKLDMEPLRVLSSISLDKSIREVDGSLQIAKVYKSNRTEFFGIIWESSKGNPCFQGREYSEVTKPNVRYIDPDTFEIWDSDLPFKLLEISQNLYGDEVEFVQECYPDGFLRSDITEKNKFVLKMVLKDAVYKRFIKEQTKEEESLLIEETDES